jgi:GT2 family glycosyltransferase
MDAGVPRITLAIVTRDRADHFERCVLPSLLRLPPGAAEVLVVDQSTGDATRTLAERVPGVRYLRSGPGLSHGRNVALDAASTPLVAFTDDDVEFGPGWLEGIREGFARDPRIGAVCGLGVDPAGRAVPGRPPGLYTWPTNPFGLGQGFNMALRREAVAEVAVFDERLGMGAEFRSAEDSDMVYRVMRAGWTILLHAGITVVHHTWRHGRDELRLHEGYGMGAGAQTAKHLRRGDRTAGRLALGEARGHALTLARSTLKVRPRVAMIQLAWAAGFARGFIRARTRGL